MQKSLKIIAVVSWHKEEGCIRFQFHNIICICHWQATVLSVGILSIPSAKSASASEKSFDFFYRLTTSISDYYHNPGRPDNAGANQEEGGFHCSSKEKMKA